MLKRLPDSIAICVAAGAFFLFSSCTSPSSTVDTPTAPTCDDPHTIQSLPVTLGEEGATYCLGDGVAGATGEITIAADNVTLYGGGTVEIKSKITVPCKTWSSTCADGYLGAVIQDVRTSGGIEFWLGGNHKVLGECDALEECTCKVGGITLWGSSDNLISGCRFETSESSQVRISNEVGGAAKNNTFEKSLFLGDNVPDTHFIWLSRDEGTIFQDNLVRVRGIPGGGGMMPSFGSNGNIIRRNTFSMEWVTPAYAASQSISNMFTLRDGTKNLTFEENRVYGNGCIFIFHAGSEGPTGPPQEGNVFRHNLIYQLPVIQDDGQEITAPAFWVHTDPLPFDV
ncbi:MAG: right-handed parallel beta-helix repeat-containing protein, partial [Pseudomonadota bacterium]